MSRYLRPIRRGEFDLANISLIDADPITGASFEQCMDEWEQERDRVCAGVDKTRWWQLWRVVANRWRLMSLLSWRGY